MVARNVRVSLCMIVRDEERNLRECLAPVAELFDEIVIIDTGSRDSTKTIAREFTQRVYDFAWCDDFSAARNESLRHARGDWIFWLDADDRLRPEQVARLGALIEKLDDRPRVFAMDTLLLPANAEEESWIVTHPRLFRRHPEVHWRGRVHEQLTPEFRTLGYQWEFSDVQIDHVGYRDRALRERKARRKLRLLRMDYAVDPDNPSILLHLGMMLLHTNRREARAHLQRLVEMGLGAKTFMRRVYDSLAELSMLEGKPAEAARFAEQGLLLFPDDEHLRFAQASAYYTMEDYAAAACALKTIIDCPTMRRMWFGALGNVRAKLAPRMLGAVQRMQQAYTEAEATLEGVLHNFPDDISTWYNLGLVYLDQGLGLKLAPLVQRLLTLPCGAISAGLLAALWHLRHGNPELAGPIIDDLIAQAPHLPRPRMLRAEWLSRRAAPLEAQLRALHDVLRAQPGNVEARRWIETVKQLQQAPLAAAGSDWSNSVVLMPGVPVA